MKAFFTIRQNNFCGFTNFTFGAKRQKMKNIFKKNLYFGDLLLNLGTQFRNGALPNEKLKRTILL
ncbi:MAG: hypothetical protein DBX55_05885 [Verrucomicrobia bacterium]|nr:MAG: hypothetical protein DBX55_05885 [Verrucomicrobiota bacterium]